MISRGNISDRIPEWTRLAGTPGDYLVHSTAQTRVS